ncbi:MAG: hypothetical protein FRX49_05181 [Trebouxia sp. A1-2]|nr:MAG: hypothetical protein FRX49_05181 [Trebouxia sp. A1-2]
MRGPELHAGPPLLPELCSGQENLGSLGAAGSHAAPSGVACPREASGTAAKVPSAVKASLEGTPDWTAAAPGVGGFVADDLEPKKDAAAEAKGAAGAEPVEGAAAASAAGSAAEAEAVLLLSARGAFEAELKVLLLWAQPRPLLKADSLLQHLLGPRRKTSLVCRRQKPLPVSGGGVGDKSATIGRPVADWSPSPPPDTGNLRVPVSAAAALGAEGGGPAAASATAGPPLLVPKDWGKWTKLPKASRVCGGGTRSKPAGSQSQNKAPAAAQPAKGLKHLPLAWQKTSQVCQMLEGFQLACLWEELAWQLQQTESPSAVPRVQLKWKGDPPLEGLDAEWPSDTPLLGTGLLKALPLGPLPSTGLSPGRAYLMRRQHGLTLRHMQGDHVQEV